MPFSTNCNNLLYEIFYKYSYLWHVIAHFGKIFFHEPIYYKMEKFCVSISKISLCIHSHSNKEDHNSKFGRDTGEGFWENLEANFLKIYQDFFRTIFKNIFVDFSTNYSFVSGFFWSLHATRSLQLLNLV